MTLYDRIYSVIRAKKEGLNQIAMRALFRPDKTGETQMVSTGFVSHLCQAADVLTKTSKPAGCNQLWITRRTTRTYDKALLKLVYRDSHGGKVEGAESITEEAEDVETQAPEAGGAGGAALGLMNDEEEVEEGEAEKAEVPYGKVQTHIFEIYEDL